MNTSSPTNSSVLNSMIATTNTAITNAVNSANSMLGMNNGRNSNSSTWTSWIPSWWILLILGILITGVTLGLVYKDKVVDWWRVNVQKQDTTPPPPAAPTEDELAAPPKNPLDASHLVEKVLPVGGKNEVFSVSANKYTYYDAEPLCRALGAELATYDQVKEAWSHGADWCNYGWVKGQMAVYPTNKDTYDKLQKGPAEQAAVCGKPGVNGGFFDNPELRFGVTCFGPKPAQSQNDETKITAGLPLSPDALEIDKKIQQFKRETDSIGILPFNSKAWSS